MGVKITETILRDAHQSLIATRMKTDEMLPIAEKLDKVGYYSLEAWGGTLTLQGDEGIRMTSTSGGITMDGGAGNTVRINNLPLSTTGYAPSGTPVGGLFVYKTSPINDVGTIMIRLI